jgi:hypothetical protein
MTLERFRARLIAVGLALLVATGPVLADDDRSAAVQPAPVPDSLRNGLLIGAGVGFAAGFLTLAAVNAAKTASGPIWDGEALGYYTTAGLAGAAVGAGFGAVVDALHRQVTGTRPPWTWDAVPLLGRRGLAVVLRRRPG